WFALAAILAIIVLIRVGKWYGDHLYLKDFLKKKQRKSSDIALPRRRILFSLGILLVLIFSKYFYMASMTSYFTFYLIDKFHVTVQESQFYLFAFMGAVAAGTMIGGPLGDRFGRKHIIW